MIDIKRLLNNKYTKYLISILLGLGLASLFRKVCNGKNCYNFVAPSLKDLKNIEQKEIYKFDNKCYSFIPEATYCNENKKIINIDNKY